MSALLALAFIASAVAMPVVADRLVWAGRSGWLMFGAASWIATGLLLIRSYGAAS